jgi:hypothetical protein
MSALCERKFNLCLLKTPVTGAFPEEEKPTVATVSEALCVMCGDEANCFLLGT